MNCKTINKTIKQMLALLLAAAMVATSFSVPGKAAEGEDPIDESIVVAEETVEEETTVEPEQSTKPEVTVEIQEEGEAIPVEEEEQAVELEGAGNECDTLIRAIDNYAKWKDEETTSGFNKNHDMPTEVNISVHWPANNTGYSALTGDSLTSAITALKSEDRPIDVEKGYVVEIPSTDEHGKAQALGYIDNYKSFGSGDPELNKGNFLSYQVVSPVINTNTVKSMDLYTLWGTAWHKETYNLENLNEYDQDGKVIINFITNVSYAAATNGKKLSFFVDWDSTGSQNALTLYQIDYSRVTLATKPLDIPDVTVSKRDKTEWSSAESPFSIGLPKYEECVPTGTYTVSTNFVPAVRGEGESKEYVYETKVRIPRTTLKYQNEYYGFSAEPAKQSGYYMGYSIKVPKDGRLLLNWGKHVDESVWTKEYEISKVADKIENDTYTINFFSIVSSGVKAAQDPETLSFGIQYKNEEGYSGDQYTQYPAVYYEFDFTDVTLGDAPTIDAATVKPNDQFNTFNAKEGAILAGIKKAYALEADQRTLTDDDIVWDIASKEITVDDVSLPNDNPTTDEQINENWQSQFATYADHSVPTVAANRNKLVALVYVKSEEADSEYITTLDALEKLPEGTYKVAVIVGYANGSETPAVRVTKAKYDAAVNAAATMIVLPAYQAKVETPADGKVSVTASTTLDDIKEKISSVKIKEYNDGSADHVDFDGQVVWNKSELLNPEDDKTNYYLLSLKNYKTGADLKAGDYSSLTSGSISANVCAEKRRYRKGGLTSDIVYSDVIVKPAVVDLIPKTNLQVAVSNFTIAKATEEADFRTELLKKISTLKDGTTNISTANNSNIVWTAQEAANGEKYLFACEYKLDGTTKLYSEMIASAGIYDAVLSVTRYTNQGTAQAPEYAADITAKATFKVTVAEAHELCFTPDTIAVPLGYTKADFEAFYGKDAAARKALVKDLGVTTTKQVFWSDDTTGLNTVGSTLNYYILDASISELTSVGAATATIKLKEATGKKTADQIAALPAVNGVTPATVTIYVRAAYEIKLNGGVSPLSVPKVSAAATDDLTKATLQPKLAPVVSEFTEYYVNDQEEVVPVYGKAMKPQPTWGTLTAEQIAALTAPVYKLSLSGITASQLTGGTGVDGTTVTVTLTKYEKGKSAVAVAHNTINVIVTNVGAINTAETAQNTSVVIPYMKTSNGAMDTDAMFDAIRAQLEGKVNVTKVTTGKPAAVKAVNKQALIKQYEGKNFKGEYYTWDVYSDFTGVTSVTSGTPASVSAPITVEYYNIAAESSSLGSPADSRPISLTVRVTPENGYFDDSSYTAAYTTNTVSDAYDLVKTSGEGMLEDIKSEIAAQMVKAWENTVEAKRTIKTNSADGTVIDKKYKDAILGYEYIVEIASIDGVSMTDEATQAEKLSALSKVNTNYVYTNNAGRAIPITYRVVGYYGKGVDETEENSNKTKIVYRKYPTNHSTETKTLYFNFVRNGMLNVTLTVYNNEGGILEGATTVKVEAGRSLNYVDDFAGNNSTYFPAAMDNYKDYVWFIKGTNTVWNIYTDPVNVDGLQLATYAPAAAKEVTGTDSSKAYYSIAKVPNFVYTGKNIAPTYTVYMSDDGQSLGEEISAKSFKVAYQYKKDEAGTYAAYKGTPKNAGHYKATLTLTSKPVKNQEIGSVEFQITKKPTAGTTVSLGDQVVTISKDKNGNYKPVTLGINKSFKVDGVTIKLKDDYKYEILDSQYNPVYTNTGTNKSKPEFKRPGVYELNVTILGTSNFEENDIITKKIYVKEKQSLVKNAKIKFNGKQVLGRGNNELGFTLTMGDKTPFNFDPKSPQASTATPFVGDGDNAAYYQIPYSGIPALYVRYVNTDKVGTATVIVKANEGQGFSGEKTFTYKISADKTKKISKAMFNKNSIIAKLSKQVVPYIGSSYTLEDVIDAKSDGIENYVDAITYIADSITGSDAVYGTDFTATYTKNINQGKATVTFAAKDGSGYTGKFNLTFKIDKVDITSEAVGTLNATLVPTSKGKVDYYYMAENSSADDAVNNDYINENGTIRIVDTVNNIFSFAAPYNDTHVLAPLKDLKVTHNKKLTSGAGKGKSKTGYVTIKGTGNYKGTIKVYLYNPIAEE